MSWLLDIALGFLPSLWPWILGAVGGLVLFLTGRFSGAAKAGKKNAEAALNATIKGQEAARKGRADAVDQMAKGKTPQQIREANNGKW